MSHCVYNGKYNTFTLYKANEKQALHSIVPPFRNQPPAKPILTVSIDKNTITVVHSRANESVLWKVGRSTLYTTCMENYLKQIAVHHDVEYKDVESFLSSWYTSLRANKLQKRKVICFLKKDFFWEKTKTHKSANIRQKSLHVPLQNYYSLQILFQILLASILNYQPWNLQIV